MSSNTWVCLPCYADHFPFACTFESSGCLVTGQIPMQWGFGGPEGSLVTPHLVAQEDALGSRVLGVSLHKGLFIGVVRGPCLVPPVK